MRALPLLAVLVPASLAELAAQAALPIREWTVPWENSRPRDPAVAPDGRIWFVGQVGNYVARLDPASGRFERFELDAGVNPHNVIVDPAGNGWYAGNRNGTIGRIDGRTGAVTRFPMPDSAAGDPHTLVFDRNGDIWFTVQFGNFVGRLAVATGTVDLVPVPVPRSRPYGIVIDRHNRPWFDLFGTNAIGTVDPATLTFRQYPLPHERTRPRRIALTSDGAVWYTDYTRGYLGRLDPATGGVREWALPGGAGSLPYAMAVDAQDRVWLVETGMQPNRFVGFDPKSERFTDPAPVPGGGGTVRHMVFDPKTGVIWFGTDNNTIGRAEVGRTGRPVS
jgi:virginiamycin B lyase